MEASAQKSGRSAGRAPWKSRGATPTIVYGKPFRRTLRPTTPGSASKDCRQYASLRTRTGSAPAIVPSPGAKTLPTWAGTPSTWKYGPATSSLSRSSRRPESSRKFAMLSIVPVIPENTERVAASMSRNVGYENVPNASSAATSRMSTSSSGSAYEGGRSRRASITVNNAVLPATPSAIVMNAAAVKPGARIIRRQPNLMSCSRPSSHLRTAPHPASRVPPGISPLRFCPCHPFGPARVHNITGRIIG